MAIALEDTAPNAFGGSSVVLTPAGGAPASGEVIYVSVTYVPFSANAFPTSYTLSGFTQLARIDDNNNCDLVLFRKVAGGSEPTSYTVTWSGGSDYRAIGSLIVLSGVNTTTPDGTPVTAADTSSNTTFDIPALTTGSANSWDLAVVAGGGNVDPSASGTNVVFSGWGSSLVERTDFGYDYASLGVATALRASAGTQAATSVTNDLIVADTSLAIRVEIFETAGATAVAAQSHFRWRDDNGSESAASWLTSEDVNITRARSTNTRLRVQVDTTNDLASSQMQIEYKLSTDATYAKVQVPDATALAYGAVGTVTTTGTVAPTVAYPAGITAGQLLIMVIGTGPETVTITTPSGWDVPTNNTGTGGAGAFAGGVGPRRVTIFTRIADGSESGSVTLALSTVANQSVIAAIFRCTKSASKDWLSAACAIGSDNVAGTAISVTFGSDPGVTAGDLVFVAFIGSEDTPTHSLQAITQTGVTYGTMTERVDQGTTTGNDTFLVLCQHAVTSGTSSAAATWTATAGGTNAANQAGPAIMIRLRQQDAAFLLATSANVAASGENTTAQLSAPAGKSTSDFDVGRLMDDENPADAINIDADDYTEVEWCIQASAVAADGTYQFRVTRTGTVLDTYTVTPTWTIGATSGFKPGFTRGSNILLTD